MTRLQLRAGLKAAIERATTHDEVLEEVEKYIIINFKQRKLPLDPMILQQKKKKRP